ncbi:hypothetical protein MHYP_G00301480 [Metynnis hypsauchen]
MELKASSEEEGGIQETSEKLSDISDEFNRDVKVEEDQNDSEYDPVGVPNDEEEHLDEELRFLIRREGGEALMRKAASESKHILPQAATAVLLKLNE